MSAQYALQTTSLTEAFWSAKDAKDAKNCNRTLFAFFAFFASFADGRGLDLQSASPIGAAA